MFMSDSAAAAARPAGGLRADYGFVATMDREIRRDPERYVGYGITDSWDEIVETLQGAPIEIYTDVDGTSRARDKTEAGMSREAWGQAMDASDLAHGEVMSLHTTVHAHMSKIRELQSADRRRQRAITDLLETDRRRREEMRELRAADRTRQQQIIQTLTVIQTLQIGHHTAGASDSLTGIGDGITGAGYYITGTAGTRWGSCTARAARGGW
ncbi:hypothetical protein Tco_1312465 [Tanacetum coccineum]